MATKGAGCGFGMGGGAKVSTGFGVSMIAGGCRVVDVGLAVDGRTRAMGAGAEEATAL